MPNLEFDLTMESYGSGGRSDDKRAKREIANMNERRRMQNINAGFHSLRAMLPQRHDGEKLSKAAILQHTAGYIYDLERQVHKLGTQVKELKRVIGDTGVDLAGAEWQKIMDLAPDCPGCKRKKYETTNRVDFDSSPTGGDGGSSTESSSEQEVNSRYRVRRSNGNGRVSSSEVTLRKQLHRIEKQLEEEKHMRKMLEEELNFQGHKVMVSGLNGRLSGASGGHHHQYHPATDPMADEVEVASESIEIEMHSCPASPPDSVLIPEHTYHATATHYSTQGGTLLTSAATGATGQLRTTTSTGQRKNAIALPIDQPFVPLTENHHVPSSVVSSTAASLPVVTQVAPATLKVTTASAVSAGQLVVLVDSKGNYVTQDHGTLKTATINGNQVVQLMAGTKLATIASKPITTTNSSNSTTTVKAVSMAEAAKTAAAAAAAAQNPRQTLNTIVEAIRHLEGDHLFGGESNGQPVKTEVAKLVVKTTATTAKKDEEHVEESAEQCTDAKVILASMASGELPPSSVSTTARPQIIQIHQRPNVIVATSMEN